MRYYTKDIYSKMTDIYTPSLRIGKAYKLEPEENYHIIDFERLQTLYNFDEKFSIDDIAEKPNKTKPLYLKDNPVILNDQDYEEFISLLHRGINYSEVESFINEHNYKPPRTVDCLEFNHADGRKEVLELYPLNIEIRDMKLIPESKIHYMDELKRDEMFKDFSMKFVQDEKKNTYISLKNDLIPYEIILDESFIKQRIKDNKAFKEMTEEKINQLSSSNKEMRLGSLMDELKKDLEERQKDALRNLSSKSKKDQKKESEELFIN